MNGCEAHNVCKVHFGHHANPDELNDFVGFSGPRYGTFLAVTFPVCGGRRSSNSAFLISPKALSQNPFEDLSGGTFWQLSFGELDPARDLVIGKGTPAMID